MGNGRKTQTRSDPQRVRTEEWREANRHCQRQTTRFTEALCQPPPPPFGLTQTCPNTAIQRLGGRRTPSASSELSGPEQAGASFTR